MKFEKGGVGDMDEGKKIKKGKRNTNTRNHTKDPRRRELNKKKEAVKQAGFQGGATLSKGG